MRAGGRGMGTKSRTQPGGERVNRVIGILCASLIAMALAAAPAAAKTIEPYVYSASSFTGTGDPQVNPFNSARFLAVDDASGNVYVMDSGNGGLVRQFDATGAPVPFSAPELGGERSITLGSWFDGFGLGAEIAVDNTGGPTQGNIFAGRVSFAPAEPLVFGFKPSGASLGPKWPICGLGCGKPENFLEIDGVGVDPDGTPWVSSQPFFGTPPHELNPFGLDGLRHPSKETFTIGQGGHDIFGDKCCKEGSTALGPRRFLFDNQGNLYATGNSIVGCACGFRMLKYDPDKKLLNPVFSPVISNTAGGFGGGGERGQLSIDRTSNNIFINYGDRVDVYNPEGKLIDVVGLGQLSLSTGVAVNSNSDRLYVTNGDGANKVDIYEPGPAVTVPDATTGEVTEIIASTVKLNAVVDPDGGGDTTECYFEYGTSTMSNKAPCTDPVLDSEGGPQTVSAEAKELDCQIAGAFCSFLPKVKGLKYFYRVVTKNASGPAQSGEIKTFRNSDEPILGTPTVKEVNSDGADVDFNLDPEGGETTVRVEYGTTTAYGSSVEKQYPFAYSARPEEPLDMTLRLTGLSDNTTYHYQVVATNPSGTTETVDRTFNTFAAVDFSDSCPNALSRQQTGAAKLLDCRSYELVSAADQGGYNVESDLVPNQHPFPGYPYADDKLLYGIHGGGIPNTGSPTIRGLDPYVATRGADGWTTEYVGIPVKGTPSLEPFSSTLAGAGSSLSAFAFAGDDLCDPCFGDGTAGVPLRLPNGGLVQGMIGSLPVSDPIPAGEIAKPLSADGTVFVFGSEDRFEPDGNQGGLSIYARDLTTGETHVASKTPAGTTMTGDIAQLDISADGSRVLIGEHVSTDAAGNDHYRLFMNVDGASETVALTPGATNGALYAGMSSDGTEVYFTTSDPLSGDADTSADLYRADVSSTAATLARVSTGAAGTGDTDACTPVSNWNTVAGGPNCNAIAIAGAGGVARDGGVVYFLSPELLTGPAIGTDGQPNLYRAEPGQDPEFVVTLEPSNPAVVHAVSAAGDRNTADFQLNTSGNVSVFTTRASLKLGFENRGFAQVYSHDTAQGMLRCISCTPSNAAATGDASLASNGLSVTNDGRIFFNSPEPLALRDTNGKQDVYEWSDKTVELISTGTNGNPSSLLSASADGVDAFFFTREKRAPQDKNGPVVKVYDARSAGGFFAEAEQQPCKASDECHGAGSVPAPPAIIQSTQGTPAQAPQPKRKPCRRGFVKTKGKAKGRKKGKCVKRRTRKRNGAKKRRGGKGKKAKNRTRNSTRRNG